MRDVARVELASEQLRVQVLPTLGGRISSVFDVEGDREWLWRNPALGTYACDLGANYDSNWQGGWEELFPNDAATSMDGRELPDHGELWSATWEVVDASDDAATVRTDGPVTGVVVTKQLRVEGPTLRLAYRLEHDGDRDLPYLFKLHPAVAVDGGCRLELPGGLVEAVDTDFSRILPDGELHQWPGPPGADVAQCHDPDSELREFVYVHGVPEGWVGVHDSRRGRRLRLDYPRDVFPWCWFFLTYGGWNDLQVAVLEPCTTHPKDLHVAHAAGRTPVLRPGDVRNFDVALTVSAA